MRGFTLLEVLVALLVVSITLAAANAAVGGAASRARALEQRTFAGWAAHNVLTRLWLDGFSGTTTQAVQTQAGERLRVLVDIQPRAGLRQATLTVHPAADAPEDVVLARLTGFLPALGGEAAPKPEPAP
jgi:general secretion pathway protein I